MDKRPYRVKLKYIRMKNYYWMVLCLVGILSACETTEPREQMTPPFKDDQKVTVADVERGIRSYIREETNDGEGFFTIETDSVPMQLKLVRVHTEYLSVLGPQRYFACVDLVDTHGDVYDVDFFLEGTAQEMGVTETTVHKLNGKPFYSWKQKKDKTWGKVPVKEASNDLLGVIENRDSFVFHYEVTIPPVSDSGKLWLPKARSDDWQNIEVVRQDFPSSVMELRDFQYNNEVLLATIPPHKEAQTIGISYRVVRKEKAAYEDSAPNELSLEASPLLPTGGRFQTIVDSVLEDKTEESDLIKARALYDYVIETVKYAKEGTYGTGDANFACDSRSGNCTEFHSFFISLARTAHIPARFAIGAAIPSNRNEGGVNGYHCWAEFYADGKWWPIDISEGNKYTALATYYFGHHPANRIELSKGRDLILQPGPESGAIPFLAYPVMEVLGKDQKVQVQFTFERL